MIGPGELPGSTEEATRKMRDLLKCSRTPLDALKKPVVPITALREYPESAEERDSYGNRVSNWLLAVFWENRLSASESEMFGSSKMTPVMWKKFDELLIQQAGVLGWTIWMSRAVEKRYVQWLEEEKDGPELAQRFCEAIRRRALICRGRASGSIDTPLWCAAKKDAIPELRRLKRQYKAEFGKRRRTPSFDEAREWYRETIMESPGKFPLWWGWLESLLGTLDWIKRNDPVRADSITAGTFGPAPLFDLVAARSENLSESYARRRISETAKL
jgi:hypothetical protein